MAIDRLSTGEPSAASQLPFYDPTQGQDRRASLQDIADAIDALISDDGDGMTTQYAAPNATGFSVSIAPLVNGGNVFLLLTPAAGYAAGTIVLPVLAQCQDRQELLVHCSQSVAALTINGNGATVNGGPTALAASGFFRLRFDAVFSAWYRVG
jgi:hypothetical protein